MLYKKAKKPTPAQDALNKALLELNDEEVGSERYQSILESIVKLDKVAQDEKPDQVSLDTAATIAANLLGILLIIRHEHINVITSKAMAQVRRLP